MNSSSSLKAAKASTMHERFVDSFEKKSFAIADKNVSKRWTKKGTHSNAIYLHVYYIIEAEFNRGRGRFHQLKKIAPGTGSGVISPIYRASAQISMVSASGTFVKKLQKSWEQRKTDGGKSKVLSLSAKVKELEMQWVE